jgi:hypothetical protein
MATSAFNLGSILSAQLRSVLEAEVENAQAIKDFIVSAGFEPGPERSDSEFGALKTITFQMQRRDEYGEMANHAITVPLLSILPIPMLSIEKADFEFDLDINETITTSQATPDKPKGLYASFAKTKTRRLSSQSSSHTVSQREGNISVKVSVVQTDFPLGIEKLLSLSELGIHDKQES